MGSVIQVRTITPSLKTFFYGLARRR
jgi:hypothetical protein